MGNLSIPTAPITIGLVAPPVHLLAMLRELAKGDKHLAKLLRGWERAFNKAQVDAELLAQMIEKRLKQLETVAEDVNNSTGNVVPLSAAAPQDVGAAPEVGTESAAAHGDHVHRGVSSSTKDLAAYGAVVLAGAVTQSGNTFTIGGGGGGAYCLPIVGPYATIAAAPYVAATHDAWIAGGHTGNELLAWRWSAGSEGGNALWRLRDRTNGLTLLSGLRAEPFADVDEIVTDAGANYPVDPARVALEVTSSVQGVDGDGAVTPRIQVFGPVTLRLAA